MNWHKVSMLSNDASVRFHAAFLQDDFERFFVESGSPEGAGMFKSRKPFDYTYYFSPAAVAIARDPIARYGGIECQAPAKADVHLLVCRQDCRGIPFASEC